MTTKVFASGLYVRRHENAPPFVLVQAGIKRDEFIAWLNQQQVNEKGFLNIQVCRSYSGKLYCELVQPPAPEPTTARPTMTVFTPLNSVRKPHFNDVYRAALTTNDELPFNDEIPF